MDDVISFSRMDMKNLTAAEENGIIITNPPYGERIGSRRQIDEIYAKYRSFLTENPDWSLFLLTADKEAEGKILNRPADRRRKLYNGRLETCYYQFYGKRR